MSVSTNYKTLCVVGFAVVAEAIAFAFGVAVFVCLFFAAVLLLYRQEQNTEIINRNFKTRLVCSNLSRI